MRRFISAVAVLFAATFALPALADPTWAFNPKSQEYKFDATGSSGTPIQISTPASPSVQQYRLFITCSSSTAVVTTTLQTSSVAAATVTAPTAGSPQYTRTYPCGVPIEVLSGPARAYFNAIVSAGTASIYIIGGDGL